MLRNDITKKIANLKILTKGLKGLRVKVTKNIFASDPKCVTFFDKTKVETNDLWVNCLLC